MELHPHAPQAEVSAAPPVLVVAPPRLPPVSPAAASDVWGGWVTMGLGFAALLGMVVGQTAGVVLFVLIVLARGQKVEATSVESNGLMLSLATLFALPVTVGLCWLFAWLKARASVWDYLGLKRAGWRSYVGGALGLGLIVLTWMGMTRVFDLPDIPPFVVEAYRTAEIFPLIWFAIIIAAPIMEELLFRGFFFQGLNRSRAGATGAILIPSCLWAAIHVQYGIHEIVLIFLYGIMLGVLRLKSGSILPGMVVHAFSNLVSIIEVALFLGREG